MTAETADLNAPGMCDADAPSLGLDGGCRCLVCARCGHHTGNSHQGHWWSHCKVLAGRVNASLEPGETLPIAEFLRRTSRDFHFCCPGDCELDAAKP